MSAFVAWSLLVVEKRVALLQQLNDNDNRIFTKFFNSLLNNEAVRSFTNEGHEVRQYDELLGDFERLSIKDVKTVSMLNAGQAIIFSLGLGTVLALCVGRVLRGTLGVGDVVAIHGILLQLQQPLTSLGFTYQEIRLVADRYAPAVAAPSAHAASRLSLEGPRARRARRRGTLRQRLVQLLQRHGRRRFARRELRDPAGKKTAIVGSSGSGKSTVLS